MISHYDAKQSRRSVAAVVAALIVGSAVSLVAMQGVFNYVKAMPQGDEVSIQWQTSNEYGVQSFEIERRSEDVNEFRRMGRIDARGAGSTYTYVDDGAFYKSNGNKHFTYRVKAIGTSVQQYSPTITITHDVSGVRKSWGMLKELFR